MTCALLHAVIRAAKLQLYDVGRKPTDFIRQMKKRAGRIAYNDSIDLFFFILLPFPVRRKSPFPFSLSLFRALLISECLEDCLERAIQRVEQGETRTLVTESSG